MTLPLVGIQINPPAAWQTDYIGRKSLVIYPVWWSEIEPVEGKCDWSLIDGDLKALSDRAVVLTVKNSPSWNRMDPDIECSAPRMPKKYGHFLGLLAERYPVAGFEIWNEPDIPAAVAKEMGIDHWCGGFGEERAWYYARCIYFARYYTQGTVPIIAGALAGVGPFWKEVQQVCRKYGYRYDYVSFHQYAQNWPDEKANVRSTTAYLESLGEHQLICTETNLIVPQGEAVDDDFRRDQRAYVNYVTGNVDYLGVAALCLYAMHSGWRGADILHTPSHPVYLEATGGGTVISE